MSKREEFIAGLREVADFLEKNPSVPCPRYETLYVPTDKDGLREAAKAPGHADKGAFGEQFYIDRTFGPVKITFAADRAEVCRKVVKGTREVPERVVPARTEEIIEWECTDPLLKPGVEVDA